jgi:threonine dehydrogenase-like Zn-dependent dehydrogenase
VKALFYPEFDRLEIRDCPEPEPADGEVILEVAACGLCGSELETFHNRSARRTPPLIMGHEFCGKVIETGANVPRELMGSAFVGNSVVPCGQCVRCRRGDTHLCAHRQIFGMHRPGAFAEWVAVPARVLIPWPEELPARAACLAEPLANGVHVVNLTARFAAEKVLVIGAGPIGLMAQQAFQAMRGAEVMVCDLSPGRLEVARRLGAARVVCSREADVAAEARAWTEGEGADVVIDAAGATATKKLSLAALRPGGAAVWLGLHANGIEIDSYEITLPEKQVLGTYAAKMEELVQALELMRQKKVDVTSWTEVGPLEESVPLFYRMLKPGDGALKAVIMPAEAPAWF